MTASSPTVPKQAPKGTFATVQRVVLLVLFFLMVCLAWRLWDQNMLTSDGVIQAVRAHPLLAPLIFISVYALAMLFMLPTLPLNMGAGFLWGAEFGALYTLTGCTLGAMGAFCFARTAFGQPFAQGFKSRFLASLSRSLQSGSWKVVAFARLNPAVPTSLVNFLFGLTSVRLWTFAWGTFVFSAPLAYVFAYLGHTTGGFILDGDMGRLVRIVVLTLGVGLFLVVGKRVLWRGKAPGTETEGSDS